jgi:hypothetical protein
MGAALIHANRRTDEVTEGRTDGRKDMTKLAAAFRGYPNAPEIDPKGKGEILERRAHYCKVHRVRIKHSARCSSSLVMKKVG